MSEDDDACVEQTGRERIPRAFDEVVAIVCDNDPPVCRSDSQVDMVRLRNDADFVRAHHIEPESTAHLGGVARHILIEIETKTRSRWTRSLTYLLSDSHSGRYREERAAFRRAFEGRENGSSLATRSAVHDASFARRASISSGYIR